MRFEQTTNHRNVLCRRNPLRSRLLAGSALSVACVASAFAGQYPNTATLPEQVIIQGPLPDDYKVDIPALSKLPELLVDTPQSIDVIPQQLLKDEAVSNLNDALRNVPGISLGAGEFSWQGNNPTIRGFAARNDLFLDGLRDFGSYYRDPFNLQSIGVPGGTILGSVRPWLDGRCNQPGQQIAGAGRLCRWDSRRWHGPNSARDGRSGLRACRRLGTMRRSG